MKKREADFGILFRHWLRANPQHTCAYEIKQSGGGSLPFTALEQHQEDYLVAIREGGKGVLIRVQGGGGEPDYVYLRGCRACVVVWYGREREFHVIDIGAWVLEKRKSTRKSLTCARAREISAVSVKL